jgi:hypothetical protein
LPEAQPDCGFAVEICRYNALLYVLPFLLSVSLIFDLRGVDSQAADSQSVVSQTQSTFRFNRGLYGDHHRNSSNAE